MNVLLVCALMCLGQVGGGGEAEMEALVERIRANLERVDQLLLDTSEADEVASGIDDAVDTHVQVIRDLEDLIKMMKYTPSSSSSSSSSSDQPQSPSSQPPPRENDGDNQQQQQQQGEQPQSPQEQSQDAGSQDEQSKQDPQDGTRDAASPRQDQGGPPPPDPIGDFTREDTDQRWGLLPPKLQERLLNLHVDDVPERYRLWLEAYIRRMHALESGEVR